MPNLDGAFQSCLIIFRALGKTIAVNHGADPIVSGKLKPQVFGASKSSHSGDLIGCGRAGFQQDAGLFQPLPEEPFERRQAGQRAKAALKGAFAHTGMAG